MDVVNPTNTTQSVDAVFANLYLPDGMQIGRIEQTTAQSIAARGTTTLEFPVKLFAQGSGAVLAYVIQNKKAPTITVKGTIVSLGVSIPFEEFI